MNIVIVATSLYLHEVCEIKRAAFKASLQELVSVGLRGSYCHLPGTLWQGAGNQALEHKKSKHPILLKGSGDLAVKSHYEQKSTPAL